MPTPRVPDYQGGSIAGLIPALLGPRGTQDIPQWMPACVQGANQVVLLVLDGLGWHQLQEHHQHAPMSKKDGDPLTSHAIERDVALQDVGARISNS